MNTQSLEVTTWLAIWRPDCARVSHYTSSLCTETNRRTLCSQESVWWTLLINKHRHRETWVSSADRAAAVWVHFNSALSSICSDYTSEQLPSVLMCWWDTGKSSMAVIGTALSIHWSNVAVWHWLLGIILVLIFISERKSIGAWTLFTLFISVHVEKYWLMCTDGTSVRVCVNVAKKCLIFFALHPNRTELEWSKMWFSGRLSAVTWWYSKTVCTCAFHFLSCQM